MEIRQTANFSHINNVRIEVNCANKAGFTVTKLEISKDGSSNWLDITATALDAAQTGKYVYTIKKAHIAALTGYTGNHLNAGDKIYLRETITLLECGAGNLTYNAYYGDGTTFCTPAAASGSLDVNALNPPYSVDYSRSGYQNNIDYGQEGWFRTKIENNSLSSDAKMYKVYVSLYDNKYATKPPHRFRRVYLMKDATTILIGDTICRIPMDSNISMLSTDFTAGSPFNLGAHNKIYKINLDKLPPATTQPMRDAYTAAGLSDFDGDGIYSDIASGDTVGLRIIYDFYIENNIVTCSNGGQNTLFGGDYILSRVFWENACKIPYSYSKAPNANSSTNWMIITGGWGPPTVTIDNPMLEDTDPTILTVRMENVNISNGVYGYPWVKTTTTRIHMVEITLPEGLDYDNTGGGIKIYNGNTNSYSSGTLASTISWDANTRILSFRNTHTVFTGGHLFYNIPVVANNTPDNLKSLNVKHTFEVQNMNTGPHEWACYNTTVPYIQVLPCYRLEMAAFTAERASFGWENTSVTSTDTSNGRANENTPGIALQAFGPYDYMNFTTDIDVNNNITLSTDEKVVVRLSWTVANAGVTFDIPSSDATREISISYKGVGASDYSLVATINRSSANWNDLVTMLNSNPNHSIAINISSFIGSGKAISALGIGDKIKVEWKTRATANIPNIPTDIPITAEVYTQLGNNAPQTCSPLINTLKGFNYRLPSITTISSLYPQTRVTDTKACLMRWTLGGSLGSGTEVFPNEYRPSAITDTMTFLINTLVQINGLFFTNTYEGASVVTLASDDYTVTYPGNGRTLITIPQPPLMRETYNAYWDGWWLTGNYDIICIDPAKTNITTTIEFICTDYPTSSAPQTYKKTGTTHAHKDGTLTDEFKYQYSINTPQATISPKTAIASWTFNIQNGSSWAATDPILPNSWVAFECDAGITPYELIDDLGTTIASASGTGFISYGNNKWWVKLGENFSCPTTKTYTVNCNYTACSGTPGMNILYSTSRLTYPANPDDGFGGVYNGSPVCYKPFVRVSMTPPTTNFSGTLVHRPTPIGTSDPLTGTQVTAGKNIFCDTVGFRATFINGTDAPMYNLKLEIPLPANSGYTWSSLPSYHCGPVQVKYGNGAWETPLSAQMQGTNLVIVLDDSFDPAKGAGAFNYNDNSDEVYVDFTLHIGCGFVNKTQLKANFYSESGCGAPTTKIFSSGQIQINGLAKPPVYTWDNLNLVQTPYTGTSGNDGSMVLTGAFRSISPTEDNTKAIIDLPANLMLTGHNSSQLTFTQEGTRLTADLPPAGSGTGSISNFSINLSPINPATWTVDTFYLYLYVGKITRLNCLGSECSLMETGDDIDSVMLNMDKVKVKFSEEITANSWYNDPTTERVQIQYALVNYGDLDAARLTVDLVYFDGIDYIPVDGSIGGGRVVNGILAHDTIPLTLNINVSYMQDVCNMFLLLRKWTDEPGAMNAYLADSAAIAVPVPIYHIQSGPDPICQLSGTQTIGEPAIHNYNYTWSPSTHLNHATVSPTSFSFDYENYPQWNDTTLKYAISIIRPDNRCKSVDTLPVEIKGMAWVQNLTDTTICSGSSYRIDFTDEHNPLGTTTFRWTIMNGPNVSMPASGTTPYINVAQVRNTGTQPIVLQVQVTPKKGGCDGVTKTYFITVNPKPRTNYIPDQTYCAGQIVPAQTISGDNAAALYHWQFNLGDNSLAPATVGINLIPNFIAQNNGTANLTGEYYAYASYENAGITCYSDTLYFDISVEPMPSVNTVGDRLLCSGDDLSINFTGSAAGSFSWQKVSGSNIPGLATNGTGNISLNNIQNTGNNPIQAVYAVTPISVSGRCIGSADNFIIAIYPIPSLTSLKTFTQCSGEQFNYTLTSVVNGVGFTWEVFSIKNHELKITKSAIQATVLAESAVPPSRNLVTHNS
jgi:hypothetical protein